MKVQSLALTMKKRVFFGTVTPVRHLFLKLRAWVVQRLVLSTALLVMLEICWKRSCAFAGSGSSRALLKRSSTLQSRR